MRGSGERRSQRSKPKLEYEIAVPGENRSGFALSHAENASGVMLTNGSSGGPGSWGTSRGKPADCVARSMSRIGRPPSDSWCEFGAVFGQGIGEADHAIRRQAGQNLAGKQLGDRTNSEQGIHAGRLVRIVGAPAEALDRRLPIADDAQHERGRLQRQGTEFGL